MLKYFENNDKYRFGSALNCSTYIDPKFVLFLMHTNFRIPQNENQGTFKLIQIRFDWPKSKITYMYYNKKKMYVSSIE